MMDLFDSGELTWSSRRDPLKDTFSFLSFPQFTEIQKLRKKKWDDAVKRSNIQAMFPSFWDLYCICIYIII